MDLGASSISLSVSDFGASLEHGLKARGVLLDNETDENRRGPASVMLTAPDRNPILVDQHLARRGRTAGTE